MRDVTKEARDEMGGVGIADQRPLSRGRGMGGWTSGRNCDRIK